MTKPNHLSVVCKLSLVTIAMLGAFPALAADPIGPYVGGSLGVTRGQFDNPASITPYVGPGFVVNSRSEDDSDKGAKIFGGYRMTQNFAIEAGVWLIAPRQTQRRRGQIVQSFWVF